MARFDSGNTNKNKELDLKAQQEAQQKQMLNDAMFDDDEKEESSTTPVVQTKGAKISTAVGTKASVKSMRLDNNLIEAVLYLVNYERLFGKNPKANENQVFASAIKEYVEQPENAKKINKMKRFQEDN